MSNYTTPFRAALFDMDGTLVDNSDVHVRAFEIFCNRYGVRDWQERLSNAFGRGSDDIMRMLLPEEIIQEKGLQALGDEKEAIYREIYAPIITPQPGLLAFLAECESEGLRSAVGSSGYKANVDFVLDKCNIRRYFEATVAGDEVTRCKPDPEIYLTAAAKLGLAPCECVVFEDAEAGIEAAKRAGMKVVALATTFDREFLATTDADMIIGDFRDISVEQLRTLVEG